MQDLPLLRFIPFRRADVLAMCLADNRLTNEQQHQFSVAVTHIENYFQNDFHHIRQTLKDRYAPLDPDADTRAVAEFRQPDSTHELIETLAKLLDRASYEKVTDKGLQRAFGSSSLFQVRLYVDLDEFDEVLLYVRGASRREETLRELFGLWRRKVVFTNYDRVLLYIRFKDTLDSDSALGECQPGSTLLKLFQNVPEADLEILFPNIRVGMRLLDKLVIGVPAVISGGLVLSTKLGATLLLLGSLLGFWLGISSEPVHLDKASLLVLLAGAGALVGYLWKQFSNFRNRKLKYTQRLTENLYFKVLDNNAGALLRILDDAEESEVKESVIAYYFLLAEGRPLTSLELDQTIEAWFVDRWQCKLDFEIEDALNKLQRLNLAEFDGERWAPAGFDAR
tara:strand:- start:174075 stop:175259 length:1185 start_codon:yes stop_codon:yes gene_type:complete